MGKPLKIIISTITILVLLLLATVCLLPFVINPNDYKPEIAKFVKTNTGRELILEGDLKLSLFPWVGISTGKLSLNNVPGFQIQSFATLEEANIKIRLLPLLSKKVDVNYIVVKGLVLNLAKNKQGISNWDDLAKPAETKIIAPVAINTGLLNENSALAAFAIGGITLEKAQINWDDPSTEQHFEIKDLSLNSDKVTFDQPVGIFVSCTALNSKAVTNHAIKLTTELTVTQAVEIFKLHHSTLQIISTGENIPGKSLITNLSINDLELEPAQQIAKIQGLQLKMADLTVSAELTGTNLKDKPSFQGPIKIASFSPIKFMQQLDIKVPVLQKPSSLSNLAMTFDLTATTNSIELQKLDMSLDDSLVKGSFGIKDFSEPASHFALTIDTLDLDRYLAPVNKSTKAIVTPSVLVATGFSIVPVETLRTYTAEGKVSLGKLKVNDLVMQDVDLTLNTKNGLVTTHQSIKQIYQGSYVGDLIMDTRGVKPTLAINEQINRLQLEPLLNDVNGTAQMSGLINLSAQLQGQGRKIDELKSTLNGKLSFELKDSVIKGFNLQKIIDEGKALIKGSALPGDPKNDQTLFSEMTGTATLNNGLLQNNDLVAISPKLRVDGKGTINLVSDALDYKIDAKLIDTDVPATDPKHIKGAVGLNINGTLAQPSYTLDLASLLTEQNKVKIEKLIDKLDKKIGPGLGDLLKGFLK